MIASFKKEELIVYLILIASTVLMIYLYGTIDHLKSEYIDWDCNFYQKIADSAPHLSKNIPRPFSYRLLGPYIIGLLPGNIDNNFYIATIVVLIVTTLLLYYTLTQYNVSSNYALLATIMFTFNKHFFGFVSWNYYHINDVLIALYFLLMLNALKANKTIIIVLILLLGSMTKETILISIPMIIVYNYERTILNNIKYYYFGMILCILALVSLRLYLPYLGGLSLYEAFIQHSKKLYSFKGIYKLLINPYVPLSIIPIIYYKKSIELLLINKHLFVYFILVIISSLFGSNMERLLMPSYFVFYYLIGVILQDLKINNKIEILAFTFTMSFISSFHYMIGRYQLPSRSITILLSGGALILVTCIYLLVAVKQNNYKCVL